MEVSTAIAPSRNAEVAIRLHGRLDGGKIQLLTRTGLDWSRRYPRTIEALRSLPVKTAYLDGELCALRPDGVPAFSRLQAAIDEGRTVAYERIWPRRAA